MNNPSQKIKNKPSHTNGITPNVSGNGNIIKDEPLSITLDAWQSNKSARLSRPIYWPKYRQTIKKHLWWSIATILVCNGAWSLFNGFFHPPRYTTAVILEFNQNVANAKKEIIKTDYFLFSMADSLGENAREDWQLLQNLYDNMDARPTAMNAMLTISYSDVDPRQSANIANLAGRQLIRHLNELYNVKTNDPTATLNAQLNEAKETLVLAQQSLEQFQVDYPWIANTTPANASSQQQLSGQQQSLSQLTRDINTLTNTLNGIKSGQSIEEANGVYRSLLTHMSNLRLPGAAELAKDYYSLYNQREQIKRRQYYTQDLQFKSVSADITALQSKIKTRLSAHLKQLQQKETAIRSQLERAQSSLSRSQQLQQRYAELQREVNLNQQTFDKIQSAWQRAKASESPNWANARILQHAVPPPQRSAFLPDLQTMLKASFLGLMLSLMVISLVAYRDDTVKDTEELESILNLPVLAELPDDNPSPARDAFGINLSRQAGKTFFPPASGRSARTPSEGRLLDFQNAIQNLQIMLSSIDKKEKNTFLIAGLDETEGQTQLAAQLAAAFANAHQPTLLIDGNLRNGSLSAALDGKPTPGLTDLLQSNLKIKTDTLSRIIQKTGISGLYFIAAGKPVNDPAAILTNPRMDALFELLKQHFSTIIIDPPPLSGAQDLFIFKRLAYQAVMVTRYGHTRIPDLQKHLKQFVLNRLSLRGIVITGVPEDRG